MLVIVAQTIPIAIDLDGNDRKLRVGIVGLFRSQGYANKAQFNMMFCTIKNNSSNMLKEVEAIILIIIVGAAYR